MFSTSLDFSEEEDGSENYNENYHQAVNIRILQNKSQLGGFIRTDLTEDISCYKLDSLVTKSLLDLTKVDEDSGRTEEDNNLDGCDNQDIGLEQTQLSATILGNSQQLIPSTVTCNFFLFPE